MNKKLILILLAIVLVVSSTFFLVSCGEEVSIDHLEMYSMPKTDYNLGEALDIKDAKLRVVYKDNTEKLVDITSSMLSGFDPNTLGVQYIKVYYENHNTVFTVTVSRSVSTSVELVIPEGNLNYVEGQLLRTEGTYMQVNFLDGTTERIDVTKEMCSGYDANKLGSQIINVVGYLDGVEYTSSFVVTVVERELIGIEVTTVPTKQIYYVGDSALDLTGGVLFLKYNSGYSEYVQMTDVSGNPIKGLEVTWDNTKVNNRSTVNVTYGFNTTTFQIQVKIRDVSSYSVKADTIKPQMQNVDLDLTGMVVTIDYNNGESEVVTLPSDKISVEGFDKTQTGNQEVKLVFSYGGVRLQTEGTLTVNLIPREAMTLEMVETPVIYQDTEFDVSEFSLRIVYNNGERGETFNLNDSMIVWENNVSKNIYDKEGEQSWQIVYRAGVELKYVFNVVGLEVEEIELHNASNVIAYVGKQAVTDGVTMTITYNSGLVKEDVALLPSMVVGYDINKAGLQLATINYTDKYETGFTTDLYVTVVKEISDVVVKGSYRDTYIVGQAFSPEGMILEVYYVGEGAPTIIEVPSINDDDYEEFYQEWSFRTDLASGLTFTEVGQQIVYIVNAGLTSTESIVITVENNVLEIGPIYRKVDGFYKEVGANEGFGTVLEGMDIDLTDYYIFVDFESETHDEYVQITKEMIDYNAKYTITGERIVTVYYPDYANYTGDDFLRYATTVVVKAKSVVAVRLLSAPNKTIYYQDADNYNGVGTDYEGMVLGLEYDNGTFGAIDIEEAISLSRLNIGNVDVREKGKKTISFAYRTNDDVLYEGSFEVEVVDSTPVSMAWELGEVPYVELSIGTAFNMISAGYVDNGMLKPLGELNLLINYSGSATTALVMVEDLAKEGYLVVEGYNANQAGMQDVRLVHVMDNSIYVTVKVNVVERQLKSINVINNGVVMGDGDKLEIIQNSVLDLTYLSLQLVFSDDAKTVIPMAPEYVNKSISNVNGYDINDATTGDRNVTISYTYANESTPVTKVVVFSVREKSLVKIEINDIPKQFYVEHEEFDQTQGSIMLYYDNGTTAVEYLRNASVTNATASFYIDRTRFDNSEFTGYSKVQPIKVKYGSCVTEFNVYMRDRRDVEINFDANNKYEYVYGEIGANPDENPISISLVGSNGNDILDYTVEYIPLNVWYSDKRVEGVDYTVVPRDVGEYVVVVSYNLDLVEVKDPVHNGLEDSSKTITIIKKDVYVSFYEQSKIYGTGTPDIYLTFATNEGLADSLDDVFEFSDGFRTPSFNPEYENYYSSVAYMFAGEADGKPMAVKVDGSDLIIDVFNILYKDKTTGAVVDVVTATDVGIYNLTIENKFVSPNYNIIYKDVDFVINKRQVSVKPQSIAYVYGTEVTPMIPFSTAKVDGVSESGLFGSDALAGSLAKDDVSNKTVGEYSINSGSLPISNPNYTIVLDLSDNPCVEIFVRNIYVKTDSVIKVYGETFVNPGVKFFSDPACTSESDAFASGDSIATIGTIVYPTTIDETTAVGNYKYSCEIEKTGMGANNYNVIAVNAYVEVTKRPVNVIAKATSKIYGNSDPIIAFDITPIANDSASGIVNGDAFEGRLARNAGENYGDYTILIGELNNDNYEIRFTSNTFSILRKQLFVYLDSADISKIYDGKVPAINNYVLYESREENATEYTLEEARQFISFEFKGESKGFGLYEISVLVDSNNFTVGFYNENGYTYSIEKRKVAITRNEYFDLPDNLEYKGSAYEFYAQINPDDLQHVYNNDGSYATDDDNKPLFDDPSVTLSIASATNQGVYTVRVVEIADKNYELDEENSQPITFTIKPRTIKVVINTNAENNTIEREFNNEIAYVRTTDYILENLISPTDIPNFTISLYAGEKIMNAIDVQFDESTGEIIGYDIRISENSVNPNYNVELAGEYKYKIVPKDVVIRIFDKSLTKTYDGTAPAIKTSMFAPVSAVPGFDTASVSFEFTREQNDGRDYASVGTYSIQVACSNRNFNVLTQQPNYVYEITRANVSVSVNAQSMEKSYDGKNFEFDVDDLMFTAYYGNNLIVHNFGHKVGDVDPYENFVEELKKVETAISALDSQIGLVSFTELSFAKNNLQSAKTRAGELRNVVASSLNPMQNENTVEMLSLIETVITYLQNSMDAIDNGEKENAEGYFRLITGNLMPTIKKIFDKEQSYVAFIFGTDSDNTPVEVGTHPFTVIFKDHNRNFTFLNSNKTVSVSIRTLYINVPNLSITYGRTLGAIPFELYDPRTGEVVSNDGSFALYGEPFVTKTIGNVGRYDVDISNIYLSEGGIGASPNYQLLPGDVGQVVVTKALLSIRINEVEDENVYVYGNTIGRGQLQDEYEPFLASSIPANLTNEEDIRKYQPLIDEANEWAEANGYGDLGHLEKMTLYFGDLVAPGGTGVKDEFENVLNAQFIDYRCYLNGESGTQIFDVAIFDAGEYKLTATGFRADNYEIKVIPGVLKVAKRELKIFTPNSGYYEKEYGENVISLSYTNFAGTDNAKSVMVSRDINGDGIVDEEITLENMIWESGFVGEINPLSPDVNVSDETYEITPNQGDYVMKNYNVDFGSSVYVRIVKAPLYCTVSPVGADVKVLSSIYMDVPSASDYKFEYEGFKNGQTESELIGDKRPLVTFKNGENFFDAGTHTLGQRYLDASGIALTNYEIKVQEFQYQVKARKVYVSLTDVAPSISTEYTKFSISPYMAEVVSNNTSGVVSAKIVSGQYGYTNFVFEIEGETNEIREMFNKVNIVRRTKNESVFNLTESGSTTTHLEYYRYADLYKHSLTGSLDHETNTATLKLGNMSISTNNFVLEYVPFTATVYSSIAGVAAHMEQKLLAGDLALSDEEINELISFSVIKTSMQSVTMSVREMLANGMLSIDGSIPNATSVNSLMKYTLIDSAYNYSIKNVLTDAYYTNYYSGISGVSAVAVTDARVATYNYDSVASCLLTLRFYPESTPVVYNPTLSDSVDYKKEYNTDSIVTIKAQETLFNAMRLELSMRPNASVKAPKLEIGFNASVTDSVISLVFNYGSTGVVVKVNNNGKEGSVAYTLDYSNLFDGNVHDIRAYLDKENLTLIVSVDGNSGALLDLRGIMLEGESIINSPEDIVERSTLSLTLGGQYVIRSLTLSEQGLYDGMGAHIALPVSSSNVIKVATVLDVFETNVANLNAMFGLNNFNEAYSVNLFVDGEQVAYNSVATSIKLASGVHLVEMALYKDGALVDYDSIFLRIERETALYYVDMMTGHNAKMLVPGSQLPLYAISEDYNVQEGEDGALVSTGAITEYGYVVSSSRTQSDIYPYSYFNVNFNLEASATYDSLSATAKYMSGDYVTTMQLFTSDSSVAIEDAMVSGSSVYQGAALRFTRKQTADVAFGSENTAYTYTLELLYLVNDRLSTTVISSGTKDSAYEVIVYKDRETSYHGNNGIVLTIRSLTSDEVKVYDFASGALKADRAQIWPIVYGLGDRLTVYSATMEEVGVNSRDYVLDGQYKGSDEALTLGKDEVLSLIDNVGNALYSSYDNLVFNFNVDTSYVGVDGDKLVINVAESKLDGSGNGISLTYDLMNNNLVFNFYWQGIKSIDQVWQLNGNVAGEHKVQVMLDKTLTLADVNAYVGGDNETNLSYGNTLLTNTMGNVVHYASVKVMMDGEETTFYMPLYDDLGCWIWENGNAYGNSNAYSGVSGLTQTPTFLHTYNYTSVVASVDDVVTVEGYAVVKGTNNLYVEKGVEGTPAI
ncbi:MAG: bacterial Ig-like domain-containing protein [Clostridia bacterium]|nr:bacterial Ig-like domain-containing protein [Clostridia bacterium]